MDYFVLSFTIHFLEFIAFYEFDRGTLLIFFVIVNSYPFIS